MTINGKEFHSETQITVSEYLKMNEYNSNRIAIEINGVILPKSQYEKHILEDSDTIEIVTFMGGG